MSDTEDQPIEETEDQPMEDTEVVEDESAEEPKKPRTIPLYLTCRLCSSMYKRAVKVPCCGFNACRGCAVTHVTANKKCWNPKCKKGATLKAADLVNDDKMRANVEKRLEMDKKFKEGLKTGEILKCPVCEEVCKRGITLPCCGSWACRGCAVKQVAVKRGCWLEGCETIGITNEDLKNDELLRGAVEHFKKEGVVDEEQARQLIWNRTKLRNKNRAATKKKTKKAKLEKKYATKDKATEKKDKATEKKDKATEKKDKATEKKAAATIELHVAGVPDDTSKEDLKEAFDKFGKIEQVTLHPKSKTAFVSCGDIDTANSILEQKDKIEIAKSALKIELSKANKCADWFLHLTGMAPDTTEKELKDLLEKYGSVKSIKMGKPKEEKPPFAHVGFEAALSVRKLVNEREVELDGNKIKVVIKRQKLQKDDEGKEKNFDGTDPLVNIKGIFLKKDEAAILKLLEQFGNIVDSKFFTKDLDKIPPNVAKLVGKERKKLMSHALIKYQKHISAINAITKEKLPFKGRDIFISHKTGSGPEAFKKKLEDKMAAKLKEKAATVKKAQLKPQGGMRRVIGFNSALKRDSRGVWQQNGRDNMWQNGSGETAPPFHRDFGNMGQDSFSGMSGGRNFMDGGLENLEMKMRNQLANLSNSSFFEGYSGDGPMNGKGPGRMESKEGGWKDDDMSGGMWSRRDEGMGQNGAGMGMNGSGMGSSRGGMGMNGGGMGMNGGGGMGMNGSSGGGIDMRGSSKFSQDFSSVTGMGGASKDKVLSFSGKPSMFSSGMSGMSSGRLGTDFDIRSTSSMSAMKSGGYGSGSGMGGGSGYGMGGGSGYGMGGGSGSSYGMGGGSSSSYGMGGSSGGAFAGRTGAMGSSGMGGMGGMGSSWSGGAGRFSDMDQVPSKMRRY